MENVMPDDGLNWPGDASFSGFPKRLPDDCVEYSIYMINDQPVSVAAQRTRLNEILKAATLLQRKHLHGYIWQRDGFQLSLSSTSPAHLHGRVDFGDSLADEWVVVYLLRELSKQFPEVWISAHDTDGEFLLIEAAAALPKWLNPETADFRVWLNAGQLKIIPLSTSTSSSQNLTLPAALSMLSQPDTALLTDPAINAAAFSRIASHPAAISSTLHHSRITIPRPLAFLLHRSPAYIAPAIEAFYLRDPISLAPLNSKDLATLRFPPDDLIDMVATFPKVGFAQLRSQIFAPPPAWTGVAPRIARDESANTGMKVACGMEMLLSDPARRDARAVREMLLLLDEVGSGEETLPSDEEIAGWGGQEDDEGWLDVDYADFERELDGKDVQGKGFGDAAAQENLRKMVQRFKEFVADDDEAGGIDGVDDISDDEEVETSEFDSDEPESRNHDSTDDDADDKDDDDDNNIKEEINPPNPHHPATSTNPPTDKPPPDWSSHVADIEFEKAVSDVRGMTAADLQRSGLLDEARRLAAAETPPSSPSASNSDSDDEDTNARGEHKDLKAIMALLEAKQRERNASAPSDTATAPKQKPFFGPERPPHLLPPPSKPSQSSQKQRQHHQHNIQPKSAFPPAPSGPFDAAQSHFTKNEGAHNDDNETNNDDDDDEANEEDYTNLHSTLSPASSDDDDEYNDVDVNLARQLLASLKSESSGAAGASGGPTGNLLRALGMGGAVMPRDGDDAVRRRKTKTG